MQAVGVTVPWGECGTSVVLMLDSKCEQMVEEALDKTAELERRVTF